MPSIFDSLLNDPEDKQQSAAMIAALRRQQDFGTLGTLMGLEPTMQAGKLLQNQAQQSFSEAMNAQAQARAERMRKMDRDQAQENWEANYEQDERRIRAEGGETNDYRRFRDENAIRGQFEKLVSETNDELRYTGLIKGLASQGREPTAVEQQSMIILLNKFQDPTSVVREGEFDRAVRAQGLDNQAANLLDRIRKGEPIGPDMVRDISVLAEFYEKAALARGQRIGKQYWDIATRRGHDPYSVVTDPRWQPVPPAAPAGPQPGQVRPRPRPGTPPAPAPGGGAPAQPGGPLPGVAPGPWALPQPGGAAPAQPGGGYGPPPAGSVRRRGG